MTAFARRVRGGNGVEGTDGEIDRVRVCAGRAVVSDSDLDGFAVLGVGDLNLLSTEAGTCAGVAVTPLICQKVVNKNVIYVDICGLTNGSNEFAVRVDGATSTSNAVLVEESSAKKNNETSIFENKSCRLTIHQS